LAGLSLLSFSGCTKKSYDAAPTKGSITLDGTTFSVSAVNSFGLTGAGYQLVGSGTTATLATAVYLSLSAKPTASRDITLGAGEYVYAVTIPVGTITLTTRYYNKLGEKFSVTVSGGKVACSMTNLTETTEAGIAISGGKPLTASFGE
jgi:hypothetical protein